MRKAGGGREVTTTLPLSLLPPLILSLPIPLPLSSCSQLVDDALDQEEESLLKRPKNDIARMKCLPVSPGPLDILFDMAVLLGVGVHGVSVSVPLLCFRRGLARHGHDQTHPDPSTHRKGPGLQFGRGIRGTLERRGRRRGRRGGSERRDRRCGGPCAAWIWGKGRGGGGEGEGMKGDTKVLDLWWSLFALRGRGWVLIRTERKCLCHCFASAEA